MIALHTFISILLATASSTSTAATATTDTAAAADSKADKVVTLDAVEVRAQREKIARNIPAATDEIDTNAIVQDGLHSLTQLQNYVPGLAISSVGGRASPHYVSLRGFTNPWSAPESAVAVYVDGVPFSDFYALDQRLFDVDHIEVRKGPQGTAYGEESEAGVIDIVTRKPDATPHAWTAFSVATHGGYAADAGVSGALAPNLFGSIAASRDGGDGQINNLDGARPYDSQWGRDLRGRLLWQPNDATQFDMMLLNRKVNDRGGEMYLPVDLDAFNQLPTLGGLHLGNFDQAIDHEGYNRLDTTLAALSASWQDSNVKWSAVGSWRSSDVATSTDYDLSPQPWFFMDSSYRIREAHGELRAESIDAVDVSWHWLAGLAVDHRDLQTLRLFHTGPGNPWGLPIGVYVRTDAGLPNSTTALFGESSWRFGEAQRWEFTAGARIEHDRRALDFGPNALGAPAANLQRSDTQFLPKVALDFHVTPTQMLYASLARGGKPGGFNPGIFDASHAEYAPEKTLAGEIGIKGSAADGRVDYALDVFHNRISDYQDVVVADREFAVYVVNAHRASTQGFEGEIAWRPSERWKFGAKLGTVNARYDDDLLDPATGLRLDGHPLQQVPRYNAMLDAEFHDGPWWARMDLVGAGSFAINDFDAPTNTLREQRIAGHAVFGVHAGWRGQHWSMQFDGENLGNHRYFNNATFGFAGVALYQGAVGAVAPGRTFGITLRRDE